MSSGLTRLTHSWKEEQKTETLQPATCNLQPATFNLVSITVGVSLDLRMLLIYRIKGTFSHDHHS
jgi:hypothetical protein